MHMGTHTHAHTDHMEPKSYTGPMTDTKFTLDMTYMFINVFI